MKKCIYCGTEIDDSCIVDFCEKCGVQTFGRKMFDAIIENMTKAKENGNLCHNIPENNFQESKKTENFY